VMSVGKGNKTFIGLACINIVVAANAGGAFSPFGDITTLMVWQAGILPFFEFFSLFLPSVVNFIVPATIMTLAVPDEQPTASGDVVHMRRGGAVVVGLFGATLVTAVSFHQFLHLPPFLGMMTGLGYLKFYGYYLKRTHKAPSLNPEDPNYGDVGDVAPFDVFRHVARAEWDTLLFFYGVILSVGGLGQLGYLAVTSQLMYVELGPTWANIMVGLLSAVVDNIPVMVAVLRMEPAMNLAQWELVTLTAGVGGSLLSIGSAAGVALMGQARGYYTFFGHLKWSWAIGLGYVASILVHLWMTGEF
jgi:Na+/H+ antiporter NhaD/arsenite permease-like protein